MVPLRRWLLQARQCSDGMVLLCCLFGVIVGAIMRFIVPTPHRGGWLASMGFGGLGSLLGLGLAEYRIPIDDGNQSALFFCSLVGALLFTGLFHAADHSGR